MILYWCAERIIIHAASNALRHSSFNDVYTRAWLFEPCTGMAVILQERAEFSFQILHVPKEDTVEVFPQNGSNQSLHEEMSYRSIRDGPDFPDFENPQIGLPSVILE
jgi:hypothetical protein